MFDFLTEKRIVKIYGFLNIQNIAMPKVKGHRQGAQMIFYNIPMLSQGLYSTTHCMNLLGSH